MVWPWLYIITLSNSWAAFPPFSHCIYLLHFVVITKSDSFILVAVHYNFLLLFAFCSFFAYLVTIPCPFFFCLRLTVPLCHWAHLLHPAVNYGAGLQTGMQLRVHLTRWPTLVMSFPSHWSKSQSHSSPEFSLLIYFFFPLSPCILSSAKPFVCIYTNFSSLKSCFLLFLGLERQPSRQLDCWEWKSEWILSDTSIWIIFSQ